MLDEAELPLAEVQEEVVQQDLVLREDLDKHAIVVDARALVAQYVGELAPQLWARLDDPLHGLLGDAPPHVVAHRAVDARKVLRADLGQRLLQHAYQLGAALRHQALGRHGGHDLPRPLDVRPGAIVAHRRHPRGFSRHHTLPTEAHARLLVLEEAGELQRPEHHLDGQPDVEPCEKQRDYWNGGQERLPPCMSLLVWRLLPVPVGAERRTSTQQQQRQKPAATPP
mmetsp:Transcript_36929/g.106354  ORF Transcript_36929/g.106354 Transcript_36929/m.106354 type:complete len:226 (-) Transcript_36929:144-821(-)